MFQSSPAPKDGRYVPVSKLGERPICFNPRPPRRTGATSREVSVPWEEWVSILARPEGRALRTRCGLKIEPDEVSILARPEGRALRRFKQPLIGAHERFNPRPPRRTGATVGMLVVVAPVVQFQSSPAPKDGRYALVAAFVIAHYHVSILARPEGRALLGPV